MASSKDKETHNYSRLAIVALRGKKCRTVYDVGPLEFERILIESDKVCILGWGRYGPECWARKSDDAAAIRSLVVRYKAKVVGRDEFEGRLGGPRRRNKRA
jgi:hypothetical protein